MLKLAIGRLGLGATTPNHATSAMAMANPKSAESKMLKGIMNSGQKRRIEGGPTAVRISLGATPISSKASQATLADSGDDEESRTKAISARTPKTATSVHNFFHSKASKPTNGHPGDASELPQQPKKKKLKVANSATSGPEAVFPAPKPPQHRDYSTSGTPPPISLLSVPAPNPLLQTKPLYSLPPNLIEAIPDHGDSRDDDLGSVTTDITDSTIAGNVGGSPGQDFEERQRKRKRKKKKRRVLQENGQSSSAMFVGMNGDSRLFGDSVLE